MRNMAKRSRLPFRNLVDLEATGSTLHVARVLEISESLNSYHSAIAKSGRKSYSVDNFRVDISTGDHQFTYFGRTS